jgi:hypothetical protein
VEDPDRPIEERRVPDLGPTSMSLRCSDSEVDLLIARIAAAEATA